MPSLVANHFVVVFRIISLNMRTRTPLPRIFGRISREHRTNRTWSKCFPRGRNKWVIHYSLYVVLMPRLHHFTVSRSLSGERRTTKSASTANNRANAFPGWWQQRWASEVENSDQYRHSIISEHQCLPVVHGRSEETRVPAGKSTGNRVDQTELIQVNFLFTR